MKQLQSNGGQIGTPKLMIPVAGERRATLNRIRARAKMFGFDPQNVRPQCLRLYAKLVNNKSSLEFRVSQETSVHAAEIRLEKSDVFWCDQLALAIHKVLFISSAEAPANSALIYYPDLAYFNETGEARDLEGVYNSRLSIQTDQDVRLENFDTQLLRHVPRQQFEPTATDPLLWETTGKEFYNLESNFGLWGNRRNEIRIQYGTGSFAAIAGDPADATDPHQNYAVVQLNGFTLVRGAEALSASQANVLFEGL